MDNIPWPEIIRGLTGSGLTQPEIARLCNCGQSSVSDLLRGTTTDPRTSTGLRLLSLARLRGVYMPTWPQVDAATPASTEVTP